jgi:hypothetical protein
MQDSRRFVASHEQPEKGSTASFHLIILCIGELQRQLGGLYVKGADTGLSPLQQIWPVLQGHASTLAGKNMLFLAG